MTYAIVHYPEIDPDSINLLRSKYDPQFRLIGPHITIVFPFPEEISEVAFVSHIEDCLQQVVGFPIQLAGLEKTWDDYLCVLVGSGRQELTALHDQLYSGPLAAYLRRDLPFIPHLTLGVFTGEPGRYELALKEAEALDLEFSFVLDRISLIKINDDRTQIVREREFRLEIQQLHRQGDEKPANS